MGNNSGMTQISCPLCAGPVELVGEKPSCLIGHDFEPEELSHHLGREAGRALWSAVRALEDSVLSARWRMTQPAPPANGAEIVDRGERAAKLIRGLLHAREGDTSDTENRPQEW